MTSQTSKSPTFVFPSSLSFYPVQNPFLLCPIILSYRLECPAVQSVYRNATETLCRRDVGFFYLRCVVVVVALSYVMQMRMPFRNHVVFLGRLYTLRKYTGKYKSICNMWCPWKKKMFRRACSMQLKHIHFM